MSSFSDQLHFNLWKVGFTSWLTAEPCSQLSLPAVRVETRKQGSNPDHYRTDTGSKVQDGSAHIWGFWLHFCTMGGSGYVVPCPLLFMSVTKTNCDNSRPATRAKTIDLSPNSIANSLCIAIFKYCDSTSIVILIFI